MRSGDYVSGFPVPEYVPVSDKDALTVDCPLCGRPAGERCVYMADVWEGSRLSYREGHILIPKGSDTQKPHNPRRAVLAKQRVERWRKEHKTEAARLAAANSRQLRQVRPVWAAEAEFDRREREALRDWLRAHGHILWDTRPDGSLRGDSYAIGRMAE